MNRVNELVAKIKINDKKIEELNKDNYDTIDALHKEVLNEILKRKLFGKMKWWVGTHSVGSYPMIDRIYAAKDDDWKPIEKLIEKSKSVSWATNTVSLTDEVVIDIEGGSVCLLPRLRDTNGQRDKKPLYRIQDRPDRSIYERHMNTSLLNFVYHQEMKIDYSALEQQLVKMKDSVAIVEEAIAMLKQINK